MSIGSILYKSKINQLSPGITYIKKGSNYVPVGQLEGLPDGEHLYIRSGNFVNIYKVQSLYPIQSYNVGFDITNPWAGNVTQADIDKLITASKKLAVQIQKGIEAAKKMQKAEEKAFMKAVIGHFLIIALAAVAIGAAAYIAPAATSAGSGAGVTTATTTGGVSAGGIGASGAGLAPGLGIAGASPSAGFLGAGSVIPSAGAGVGIVTTGGNVLLPGGVVAAGTSVASSGASIFSNLAKTLGLNSVKSAVVKGAMLGGKILLTEQQQKAAAKAMQQYQQAVAEHNAAVANAIKQYYQNQLDQLAQQAQGGGQISLPGATWNTTGKVDFSKYLPYIIGGGILLLFIAMKK